MTHATKIPMTMAGQAAPASSTAFFKGIAMARVGLGWGRIHCWKKHATREWLRRRFCQTIYIAWTPGFVDKDPRISTMRRSKWESIISSSDRRPRVSLGISLQDSGHLAWTGKREEADQRTRASLLTKARPFGCCYEKLCLSTNRSDGLSWRPQYWAEVMPRGPSDSSACRELRTRMPSTKSDNAARPDLPYLILFVACQTRATQRRHLGTLLSAGPLSAIIK